MIALPPGFRLIREEDLPRIADYLDRYCDNDCDGITCTDAEYCDGRGCFECESHGDPNCCRNCLVGFAKEDLAEMTNQGATP
jgi:hypothetical protein